MKPTQKIDTVLCTLQDTQNNSTMLSRLSKKYEPYKIVISTILSARAKDEVTEIIAERLFEKYPTPEKLSHAKQQDVIQIIRKIGFYNVKSKNIINAAKMIVNEFNGKVPNTLQGLLKLPGVGRKVANCVLVYSFKKDAIPVDTHVHRISNRLGWVTTKTPEKTETALEKLVPRKHWQTINDTLVTHGKTTCTPINPFCSRCPIYKHCKRIGVKSKR